MLTLSTLMSLFAVNANIVQCDILFHRISILEGNWVIEYTSHIPTNFQTQEGVLVIYFCFAGFCNESQFRDLCLNQYKVPRQHYLCLITIWLRLLEMSSLLASHYFFKNA